MFFPERILSIKPSDRVLEVGPGGTPHPRSDIFLERVYDDADTALGQRGYAPSLQTDKAVVFYDGMKFPFSDGEFDYVICSHVLEHVENVESFLGELQRVARRGYLEFPTIYYDFIYNFPEHTTLLLYRGGVINYMLKKTIDLDKFIMVNRFFLETLHAGYTSLVNELKMFFFQGFEWQERIEARLALSLAEITFQPDELDLPSKTSPAASSSLKVWLKRMLKRQ